MGGFTVQVVVIHSVRHETARIDKLFLKINRRQSIFVGKFDNPLSFGEKLPIRGRHNRFDLLLLGGLKGTL
jgi:hypothetical protein